MTVAKAAKAVKSKFWMPAQGLVVGGDFDGHRYVFHGFEVSDFNLLVDATLYRPNWPFPTRLRLAPGQYKRLEPVSGDRAKRLAADDLIAAAYARSAVPNPFAASPPAVAATEQDEDVHVG